MLPMTELAENFGDFTPKPSTLTSAKHDAPSSVALDKGAKHALRLVLPQEPVFDDSPEMVPTPDFLNQSGAKSTNLLLKLLLDLLSSFLEAEDQLFDES